MFVLFFLNRFVVHSVRATKEYIVSTFACFFLFLQKKNVYQFKHCLQIFNENLILHGGLECI